jgi:RibD domain-containing protein
MRNSEQLTGDLVEAVTTLKNEPGGTNIAMSGSVSVVRQLLAAGLLDELHLLVHPIAIRSGMRLFDEGDRPIPLTLISSEAFETGVLNLVYGPADSVRDAGYEDAKSIWPSPNSPNSEHAWGAPTTDRLIRARQGRPGRRSRRAGRGRARGAW